MPTGEKRWEWEKVREIIEAQNYKSTIYKNDSEEERESGLSKPVGVIKESKCRKRKAAQMSWEGGEKRDREDSCSRSRDYQKVPDSVAISDT